MEQNVQNLKKAIKNIAILQFSKPLNILKGSQIKIAMEYHFLHYDD